MDYHTTSTIIAYIVTVVFPAVLAILWMNAARNLRTASEADRRAAARRVAAASDRWAAKVARADALALRQVRG
jgi:hypothetical protein